MQPTELEVDGNYTSASVILLAREMGTEVNGPVKGRGELPSDKEVTLGDFEVNLREPGKSKCPEGHALSSQEIQEKGS